MPLTADAEKKIKGILDGVTDKSAETGVPGMVFCAIDKNGKYLTTETKQEVFIHPSSVLHSQQPKSEAIMFLEHVYTQKSYAKRVSAVTNRWVVDAYDESAQWADEGN